MKRIIIRIIGVVMKVTIREVVFVKCDMTRDNNTLRYKIKSTMSTMIRGRSKIDTHRRPGR